MRYLSAALSRFKSVDPDSTWFEPSDEELPSLTKAWPSLRKGAPTPEPGIEWTASVAEKSQVFVVESHPSLTVVTAR